MATTEELKLRVVHKHDIEENWLKATNFIPKQGEMIIYDIDDNYSYERFKIGDGITNVNSLPFANLNLTSKTVSAASQLVIEDISEFSPFVNISVEASNEIRSWGNLESLGTHTSNGVTFTRNADDTITVNGTATALATCYFYPSSATLTLTPGTYILKGSATGVAVCLAKTDWTIFATSSNGTEIEFTLVEDTSFIVYAYVNANVTISNAIIKPELLGTDVVSVSVSNSVGGEVVGTYDIAQGATIKVSAVAPMIVLTTTSSAIILVTYLTEAKDILRYSAQALTDGQKAQVITNLGLESYIHNIVQQYLNNNSEQVAQNYLDTTVAEEATW